MSEHCDLTRLEEHVLTVIREFNERGRAPRFSEIRDAVKSELEMCRDPNRILERTLSRLVKSGALVKRKADANRKSSEAFYAVKEYGYLLEEYGSPLTEEHLLTIVEGMYGIAGVKHLTFTTSELFRAYAIPPEAAGMIEEVARKAYLALQHILRGKAFAHIRALLNEDRFGEKKTEILSEILREADRLRDFRRRILENSKNDSKKVAKLYGTCEVCGPRLTEDEKKMLKEWWQKLGLRGLSHIVDNELSLTSLSTSVY